jgi:menaquinone-dependent protoporphyrinogen IX oxidase
MKALILYRSYYGNTKQVAEVIAGQIHTQGHESIVQDLRQKLPDLNGIDFIIIGAPTRMARVNRKALRVLKQLRKKGFTEKPVAIFDTYGPVPTKPEEMEKSNKWLYPGAAGIMQKVAKTLGLNVYSETLRCEVRGMKGPLTDNELEKAASFTKEFLSTIGKKP